MSPSAQPSSWSQVPRTWTTTNTGTNALTPAYSSNPTSEAMARWYNEPLRSAPYNDVGLVRRTDSVTQSAVGYLSQTLSNQADRAPSSCEAQNGSSTSRQSHQPS
ncbi:uncharacterized protein PgNI_07275 [Pyricularia grisea]|uniref:Uncharacterized protein n=1 Tax=Pyricularia grisea TaxID=148305 RepID=A0A6P8B1A0_PYRGI|nr:uncharacterized protein PgNI_07275 [Pyricularia grisea]TLD08498.1 hypothetical protein PgNI_07275 [Pyricularia grisea]